MTSDEERWAEAITINRVHGPEALAFVDERIRFLRLAHDAVGVERFGQIRTRLVALRDGQSGYDDGCRSHS